MYYMNLQPLKEVIVVNNIGTTMTDLVKNLSLEFHFLSPWLAKPNWLSFFLSSNTYPKCIAFPRHLAVFGGSEWGHISTRISCIALHSTFFPSKTVLHVLRPKRHPGSCMICSVNKLRKFHSVFFLLQVRITEEQKTTHHIILLWMISTL